MSAFFEAISKESFKQKKKLKMPYKHKILLYVAEVTVKIGEQNLSAERFSTMFTFRLKATYKFK